MSTRDGRGGFANPYSITMRITLSILAGAALGILAFGLVRYAAAPEPVHDEPVHYHANFALYLDGERVRFQEERYMEDIATCRLDAGMLGPRDRVHMHQMNDEVVHVHAAGVTWGHFLANLGFAIGEGAIVDEAGVVHAAGPERRLSFVLNGERVPSIANREIVSLDRLLVYQGPTDATDAELEEMFEAIPASADAYNASHQDGVGCTSGEAPEETPADRLRRAFWF
ncbi:MAG TPA: hypothetical protein VK837_08605 [Longimicrobiales bacterium]|nr:hypothetical protein [Longimicrobiales bacterium]